MTSPDAPVATDDSAAAKGWTIPRIAAVVTALAIALFWLWIFSGAPAKENPDRLQDQAYVDGLEARCQQLRADLAELPAPTETPDPVDRAAVIDDANAIVDGFLDDLEAGAPTEGDAAKSVEGWLADWRTYLADREAYAERLRTEGGDARLELSASPLQRGVDETILTFARVNGIPDCATPGDVG
jgi:hypothetical protein